MASTDPNKIWSSIFFTERNFGEDQPYVRTFEDIEADGDHLDRLLEEYEEGLPSCMSEEITEYCKDTCTTLLETGPGGKPDKVKAWLNDIERPSQRSRSYTYRLTAYQLYTLLMLKRFGIKKSPNADRRLIYIPDLEPKDIRVLLYTASYHQIDTLRDGIWKHLALKTSIRVKLMSRGFQTFRLEFHLPYSALRRVAARGGSGNRGRLRNWEDVSYLRIPPTRKLGQAIYCVQDAHVSLVICGSDHFRWVCYAFVDTDDTSEDKQDEDESNVDPIVEIQSSPPITDPREYFLRAMEFRTKQIVSEWMYLSRKVENSVGRYIKDHPVTLSHTAAQDRLQEFNENLQWIVQATELLRNLRPRVSQALRVWERFDAPGGDICYFSDLLSETRISGSIHGIRESFEELKDIEHTLDIIYERCKDYHSRLLELGNLESHQLNRNNHEVSLETSQSALANQQISQLGLSMNLFFTPVALAIALFGTEQETLKFKRSLKSLILCALGMIFAVQLFVCVNGLARRTNWPKGLKNRLNGFKPSYDGRLMVNTDNETELNRFSGVAQHMSRYNTV